jgi:predicted nucleotidyltransferase
MITKEKILITLKKNKANLSKFGVSSIGLFGSYFHGTQTRESDIDLLIDLVPEKENFDNYMAVYDILERLFKNKKIDLVTKNGLSKYIGPAILQNVTYV